MDSIKVSTNNPPSPLVSQLFKNAPRDGKIRLVCPRFPAPACELPASPTSPPPSISVPSASSDNTDNHDTFTFYPDLREMEREEERLKTFDKWPVRFLSPEVLARNGFYYLGRGDEVRCAFCKVEIMRWIETDDPASEHKKWAPECSFLRRNANAGNATSDSPAAAGRDECGARAPALATSQVVMPGPVHPRYGSESARLRTFNDWPRSMRQKPKDLAEAGFFYTGHGDKTKCFYCDGGLKDWENDDDPWEQHARWFDRCAYVQLVKGKDFVQKVLAQSIATPGTKPKEPKPAEAAIETKPDEKSEVTPEEDAKLCKICYVEERNVCFVPCGHVVSCAKCALSTNKCPMCRRTFQNAVRLYFS